MPVAVAQVLAAVEGAASSKSCLCASVPPCLTQRHGGTRLRPYFSPFGKCRSISPNGSELRWSRLPSRGHANSQKIAFEFEDSQLTHSFPGIVDRSGRLR